MTRRREQRRARSRHPASDDAWDGQRPPAVVDAGLVTLHRLRNSDVADLVTAVNTSLEHLRPWMPWAQEPATAETMGAFVFTSQRHWEHGDDFGYTMRDGDGAVVGGCGLHTRVGQGGLAIGYWVHVDHVGKGVATAAARALTHAALALPGLDRVQIHTDRANARSAAIPPRLGYVMVRVDHRPPAAPGETGDLLIWERENPA